MAGTITASVIKNDTTSPPAFQNSAGTQIGTLCRAWVNFDGTTAAIRASFNVGSITKNGTGDYTVNFITPMSDVNYGFSGMAGSPGVRRNVLAVSQASGAVATSFLRVDVVQNGTSTLDDAIQIGISVFR